MKFFFGTQIDLHPQGILHVQLQSDIFEKRYPGTDINQHVEIAALFVRAVRYRAEHAQVACATGRGDGEDLFPVDSKGLGRAHEAIFSGIAEADHPRYGPRLPSDMASSLSRANNAAFRRNAIAS